VSQLKLETANMFARISRPCSLATRNLANRPGDPRSTICARWSPALALRASQTNMHWCGKLPNPPNPKALSKTLVESFEHEGVIDESGVYG
jgi:hypothetical protein